MKNRAMMIAVLLMLAAGLSLLAANRPATAADPARENPLERYCTACHGLDRIYEKKFPAVKWWTTIRRMSTYDGFDLDVAQQKEVFAYLKAELAVDGPGGRQKALDKALEK
jgi:hypothetical protein